MNLPDIIAIIVFVSLFVAIVAKRMINRKNGKGNCSCGCGSCVMSEKCSGSCRKENEKLPEGK